MKLCLYDAGKAGAVVGDQVYPVGEVLVGAGHIKSDYTMVDIIESLENSRGATECVQGCVKGGRSVSLSQIKLLAPIYNPSAIWAAAANYRDHQKEMQAKRGGAERADRGKDDLMAEFFLKPPSSIIGPGETIILPKISKDVDFECELCAVIGKRTKGVTEEQALDYVFGYTVCWDISQRDPWGRGIQNTRNIRKGFDTFTPLGPWIVTRDEIEDPQNLSINVEQNGKPAMRAHTKDMICNLRNHIRFLSGVVTLRSGDLITTGTPAGVRKLHDGDELRGGIEKIGEMQLNVKADV
jgi:2-keto-4-pentenoate hydratase/2-oxohepta-3-ene-1,7-dioic acid hydratase in catechol pathway